MTVPMSSGPDSLPELPRPRCRLWIILAIVEFVAIVALVFAGPYLGAVRLSATNFAGTSQIVAAGIPRPTVVWTASPPDDLLTENLRGEHLKLFTAMQRLLSRRGYACEFDEGRRIFSVSGESSAAPGSSGWTLQMVVVSPDSFAGPTSERPLALRGLCLTRVNGDAVNFLSAQVAIYAFGMGVSDVTSELRKQQLWQNWTFDVSGPGTNE